MQIAWPSKVADTVQCITHTLHTSALRRLATSCHRKLGERNGVKWANNGAKRVVSEFISNNYAAINKQMTPIKLQPGKRKGGAIGGRCRVVSSAAIDRRQQWIQTCESAALFRQYFTHSRVEKCTLCLPFPSVRCELNNFSIIQLALLALSGQITYAPCYLPEMAVHFRASSGECVRSFLIRH